MTLRDKLSISPARFFYGFIVLYFLFMLDFAARLGITSAFPSMKSELGFSDTTIGFAGSIVLAGMTVFVLPFSFIADKTSKKRSLNVMSVIWGGGCCICGAASSAFSLLFGRFLVGAGNASYAPVSVAMLTSWVNRPYWGTIIGFYNSAMSLGLALGTSIVGVLVHKFGWRAAFYGVGLLTLIFAVCSLSVSDAKTNKPKNEENSVRLSEAFSFTLKNKTLLLLGLGVGAANMGYTAMITWIPMYLVRIMGWNTVDVAAYMGPVYLIQGLCVTALSGVLIDWISRKTSPRSRALIGVPAFIGCALTFYSGFHYQWILGLAFGMFLFKIPVTGVHVATQELVPARYKSSAYGTYVLLLQGIGFFGSLLVGLLSDTYGLQKAVEYMQLVFCAGAVFMLIGGITYMVDYRRAQANDDGNIVK